MKEKNIKMNSKKNKVVRFLITFLLIILILLIIFVCVFLYNVKKNGGGLEGVVTTIVGTNQENLKNLPPIYVVLLGKSQNLTDTIMLVKYNPKEQKASMLSIPRDTFVGSSKANAEPIDKINALYQGVSPERTVQAISELTGISVTNYCLIDTEALVEMVDLIGGVYFDVPIDMDYEDFQQELYIHVKAGYQLLDGKTAEGVVRFRHNQDGSSYPEEYGGEDLGRSRTQRAFLTALAEQTLKPQNLLKIGGFIDIFYKNVETNMSISDIKDYLPYAVNFNTENLKTNILPGEATYYNNFSFYVCDEDKTKEIVEELFESDDETNSNDNESTNIINATSENEIKEKGINVELLNGTNNKNALFNVKNKLEANGYNVVETEETNITSKTTIINRSSVSENEIKNLKEILSKDIVSFGELNDDIDITIIIGTDY